MLGRGGRLRCFNGIIDCLEVGCISGVLAFCFPLYMGVVFSFSSLYMGLHKIG